MNEEYLRAAFLMLAGKSVAAVSQELKICRTSLYKLRQRATDAVRREIERPIGKNSPVHNRLLIEKETKW